MNLKTIFYDKYILYNYEAFISSISLKMHSCVICGLVFQCRLPLEFHYDIAHQFKLYQCGQCYNSYHTLFELFDHCEKYHNDNIYNVMYKYNLY